MSVSDEIVATAAGTVRGRVAGDIRRFQSIPYAAAPAASGRFAPPIPHRSWRGVRDATRFGPTAWFGVRS